MNIGRIWALRFLGQLSQSCVVPQAKLLLLDLQCLLVSLLPQLLDLFLLLIRLQIVLRLHALQLLLHFLALFVGRRCLLRQRRDLLRFLLALRRRLLLGSLQRGYLRIQLLDLLVSLNEYFTDPIDLFLQPSALVFAVFELLLELIFDFFGSSIFLLLVLEH